MLRYKHILYLNIALGVMVVAFAVNPFGIRNQASNIALAVGDWGNSGNNIFYTTGRVGIGTTGPSQLLHVYNTAADAQIAVDTHTGAAFDPMFTLRTNDRLWNLGIDNSDADKFKIATGLNWDNIDSPGAGQLGTALTIQSNGNVGIGTTAPQAKLEVNGAIRLVPQGQPASLINGLMWME